MHRAHGRVSRGSRPEGRAEAEALRRHCEQLEAQAQVYRDLPVGVCMLDTSLRYVHINDWLAALNGMAAEEHLGRTIGEVLPEVAQGVESTLRHVIETGESMIGGTVSAGTPAQPGVQRTFAHSYHQIRSGDDTVLGVRCVVEDITERKQAEEALHQARNELEMRVEERTAELQEANEALRLRGVEFAHLDRLITLGELSGALAHELNQPLCAIVSNAQAARRMLDSDVDTDEVREAIEDIVGDGQRAGQLIRRLHGLMRRGETERKPLDINTLVDEIVPIARTEFLKYRAELLTDVRHGLSPVFGDRIQLQQVILNLVLNGLEAIREGATGPREVTIRTRACKTGVTVTVHDRGHGIDATRIGRVFDAFYSTKPDGIGMGLSISKSIVEAHGGRIVARNNRDGGATFAFLLPEEGA